MPAPYRSHEEPARALALAEPRPLGRLRSTHASGATARRILAATAGIATVLAALAVAWPHAPWLVAVSLTLAFAVALWVVLASVLGLDVVVDVHEGGLVVRRSWRRPRIVSFDAIASLHVLGAGGGAPSLLLGMDDGERVEISPAMSDGGRLLAAIEAEVERPVLEDAMRALARGEPLTFGAIALELDGVRHRGDLLPWRDLDRVCVGDTGLVFVQKTTQHSFVVLATRSVPFPRVLVALLAQRTRIDTFDPFFTRWV